MRFRIKPADTFIWNLSDLVDFLIAHQNQAITIENGTEGCCARTVGLYQWLDKFSFTNVTIETSNLLEKHPVYQVKYTVPLKFVVVDKKVSAQFHNWNKNAVFGTIYGRPLWHRLGITGHLLTHHSSISQVGFAVDPKDQDQRQLFELQQLWQHSPESIANFSNIQDQLPMLHRDIRAYTPGATLTDGFVEQSKQVYTNFLIDIVAETFTTGNCFFITEKTVRPMLLKKPFVVFGSCNYLAYLRQMGFRTFGDFWDETYDGYQGAERYARILKLIDQLAVKSTDELERMYWDMQFSLDHNHNLLMSRKYNTTIKEIT